MNKLATSNRQVIFGEKELTEMKFGIDELISLANKVSKKWCKSPTVGGRI